MFKFELGIVRNITSSTQCEKRDKDFAPLNLIEIKVTV